VLRTAAVRWPDRPPRARVRPGGAGPHHRTEPRGRFRGLRLCSVPARPVPVAARRELGSQPHAAEGQRMTLSSLVFATAVLACSPARDTVDRACACPEGTEHVKTKTSAERASNAYYPQAEEFCRRKSEHGTWVIHGHYILWGPNGERLEEGEYRDGKRDGAWAYWSPSQLVARWFTQGHQDSVRVLGAPHEFTIDFCACKRQWMGAPWALGRKDWKVFGPTGPNCIVETGGEVEMAPTPKRYFQVPREVGRLP